MNQTFTNETVSMIDFIKSPTHIEALSKRKSIQQNRNENIDSKINKNKLYSSMDGQSKYYNST